MGEVLVFSSPSSRRDGAFHSSNSLLQPPANEPTTAQPSCWAFSFLPQDAKKRKLIGVNPADKATPPRRDTKEKRALCKEEVSSLISKLDSKEHMQLAVLLCVTMGLRRGEVSALSWSDVDLVNGTITINHSFDEKEGLKTAKTKAGLRILPLPQVTKDALVSYYDTKLEQYLQYFPECLDASVSTDETALIKPDMPVISGINNTRIYPASIGHWWEKHRHQFGLSGWTLHELRHTFLSLCAESGVHPSVMQALAGHASPRTTMEIYTHVNLEAKRNAVEVLDGVF